MSAPSTPDKCGGAAPPAHLGPRSVLRFVWQIDEDDRFTLGSDDFLALVGSRTAAAIGRPWSELAATLALDPGGQVARAIATHETWSGLTVWWPLATGTERLAVELSGLPVFDRDRMFRGYRGFGLCRDVGRLAALTRPTDERAAANHIPPDEAAAADNVVSFPAASAIRMCLTRARSNAASFAAATGMNSSGCDPPCASSTPSWRLPLTGLSCSINVEWCCPQTEARRRCLVTRNLPAARSPSCSRRSAWRWSAALEDFAAARRLLGEPRARGHRPDAPGRFDPAVHDHGLGGRSPRQAVRRVPRHYAVEESGRRAPCG